MHSELTVASSSELIPLLPSPRSTNTGSPSSDSFTHVSNLLSSPANEMYASLVPTLFVRVSRTLAIPTKLSMCTGCT
jgi:hypothetical protein